MANNKYKMFKNFLHNELCITKADVEEWTKETIKEVVSNYIENRYSHDTIIKTINDQVFQRFIEGRLKYGIEKEIAEIIAKKFDIVINSGDVDNG